MSTSSRALPKIVSGNDRLDDLNEVTLCRTGHEKCLTK